jgi:dihydroorotase
MKKTLIINGTLVNKGKILNSDLLINGPFIERIDKNISAPEAEIIDASGKYVFPGIIDDQVHFREPGLTHKADIYHESRAAVAGGVTSYMEMPNTIPNATTQEFLEEKYSIASRNSLANYSFYIGATNDNLEEILRTDQSRVCGVKIFMGSSTGNMLVDHIPALESIFRESPMLIATHCEDERIIQENIKDFKKKYGENVPISCHPDIRSEQACYKSSSFAVSLARKYGSNLHVLHISTEKELSLFDPGRIEDKHITAEACIHHLWFHKRDYDKMGTLIKWNPAVKQKEDRNAIRRAIHEDRIDIIATDHAPHTLDEKRNTYFKAPSGGPLIQHSLLAMLELYHKGVFDLEIIIQKMAHNPALRYKIDRRGFLEEGYYADVVIADLNRSSSVTEENIISKCGWSPFLGYKFRSSVEKTIVSGKIVYDQGKIVESGNGERLLFTR